MTTEELKDFPGLEKVQKGIQRLENVAWPEYDRKMKPDQYVKRVSKIITQEFNLLPSVLKTLAPNEFKLKIFRVRALKSIKNIGLIAEHSYPPAPIAGFGRCNLPDNPVFYSSNSPKTSLIEVIKNNRERSTEYCLTRWSIRENSENFVIQHFLQSGLHPENEFQLLADSVPEQIQEPFENQLTDDQKAGLLEMMKFLDRTFVKDTTYAVSAALAHGSLYAPHDLATDILLYPSIQSKFKGVNFAIHPNFVDRCLRLTRIYIVKVTKMDLDLNEYDISFSKFGIVKKNRVFMYNIGPDRPEFEYYFKEDFKEYFPADLKFTYSRLK